MMRSSCCMPMMELFIGHAIVATVGRDLRPSCRSMEPWLQMRTKR